MGLDGTPLEVKMGLSLVIRKISSCKQVKRFRNSLDFVILNDKSEEEHYWW